ncbi:MAG TPA: transcriptional regulator GcvA [Rhodocyclaceae bacterium]|nr:transcriptional regulator GcvA [Rhodocyclaceae bacterium]
MRAFEAAARHLSFKSAAEELHVTPGAVSQQIKQLEEYLGKPLFHRRARAVELTAEGDAMLPKIREGFDAFAAAIALVVNAEDGGKLSVNAPPSFASRWLVPRLSRFTGAHPDLALRLTTTMDTIDVRHPAKAAGGEPVVPPGDNNGVAIRYGSGDYPGHRVSLLFAADYVAACSPALLRSIRPLATPGDLRRHALIHDETIPEAEERQLWLKWFRAAGVNDIDPTSGPRFGNAALAVEAATDGLGVVLALKPLLNDAVRAGRLVLPFNVSVPSRYAYYLVVPEGIAERESVRLFSNWLLHEAASE